MATWRKRLLTKAGARTISRTRLRCQGPLFDKTSFADNRNKIGHMVPCQDRHRPSRFDEPRVTIRVHQRTRSRSPKLTFAEHQGFLPGTTMTFFKDRKNKP